MAGTGRKATKKQRVTAIKNPTKSKPAATRRKAAAATARKATGTSRKKTTATRKKTAAGGRKYSREASARVGTEMRELKAGTLRSGGSGKKVTNPKQAIAIGLSEARRGGAKVPPAPKRSAKKKR